MLGPRNDTKICSLNATKKHLFARKPGAIQSLLCKRIGGSYFRILTDAYELVRSVANKATE